MLKEKMEKMGLDIFVTKSDSLKELGLLLMGLAKDLEEEEEEEIILIANGMTKEVIFCPMEEWEKFLKNEKNL